VLKDSKVVPKGMQSLVCFSVGVCVCVCVCVFDVIIILHHIVESFRTTLHHTSYCINDKRIGHKVNFRQYFVK
jgi:hypothetical protein